MEIITIIQYLLGVVIAIEFFLVIIFFPIDNIIRVKKNLPKINLWDRKYKKRYGWWFYFAGTAFFILMYFD